MYKYFSHKFYCSIEYFGIKFDCNFLNKYCYICHIFGKKASCWYIYCFDKLHYAYFIN